jgi:hypothetical protein
MKHVIFFLVVGTILTYGVYQASEANRRDIASWTPTSTATPTIMATPTSTATPTIMATPTPGPILLDPNLYMDAQKTINGDTVELSILRKDGYLITDFGLELVKVLFSVIESGQQYRKLTINMLGTGNITKGPRYTKVLNPKQIYSCTFDRSFVDSIDDRNLWINHTTESSKIVFESADQCWLNPDIHYLQPTPTPVPPTPTDAPLVVR